MPNHKPFFICLFLMFAVTVHAQRMSRSEYIQKYQLLAISEMQRSGIPASITMAQACLESADGNSELSSKSNNHFGIKCKSDWTGARSYHDDDERNECFRKYKTVEDSYIDHSNFLLANGRYAALFQLPVTDYAGWARGLKKAGYATDPSYDKKLIDIIELFQLWRLDHKMTLEEVAQLQRQRISTGMTGKLMISLYGRRSTFEFNGLKATKAKPGETLEVIAQEAGLKMWEIRKFNDLPANYQPQPNEVIYLKNKKTKAQGMYEYHKVAEGESMHYVSQMYGIRMRRLYRLNDLRLDQPVPAGTILNLKEKRRH